MDEEENNATRDRFGEIAVAVGALVYVAAIVFYVLPLPHWIDTFLTLSLLFTPVIVGGLIYARIERSGGWSQSRRLR